MENEKDILNLILFLYNSLKAKDNVNMSKAEKMLNQLCDPGQSSFLQVGSVLANIIFDSTSEYDFRMLSAIIVYRCNILREESLVSLFISKICQIIIPDESFSLTKLLCSTIASVIVPLHVDFILNFQPNYQILFILYYYIQNKEEKGEKSIKLSDIYNYIIKYNLFDPENNTIGISTISSGILSFMQSDDASYCNLIISIFLQIPAKYEYLPIFCELITAFNNIPDCSEKMVICINKLKELLSFESFPFDKKNILDHDISIELLADYFIKYLIYYIDDESLDEEGVTIDPNDVYQIALKFCIIQDYVKERWMNDIDSFLVEIQCDPDCCPYCNVENGYIDDESDQDLIRCHSLSLIHDSISFKTFYNNTMKLIEQNLNSNPIFISHVQEVLYYVIFSFAEYGIDDDLIILPPINPNDVILYGEYIKCLTALGKPLTDMEYIQILSPESHFILKICLAQGLALNDTINFSNCIILKCIECLISMIDLFQTDADIDFFELIGKLVSKAEMDMNSFAQILFLVKNQWIKHMSNFRRVANITSIITDFLNRPNTIPIILDVFLPVLQYSFNIDELKQQSVLLLQIMTKKLPSIQISEVHLNILSEILINYVVPLIHIILIGENDFGILPESLFSVLAFYCRIQISNPVFFQFIIISIEKLKELFVNNFSIIGKNFVSFVYEYLIIKTDQDVGKFEIIQKIFEFFTLPNDDKQIFDKKNLLLIIMALFCTHIPHYAIPLCNNIPNFFNTLFYFVFEHLMEFTTEERYIYTVMYFTCVIEIPQLYNQEAHNNIIEMLKFQHMQIDSCHLLDKDDPFIAGHHLTNISKDILMNYYQQFLNSLNIKL